MITASLFIGPPLTVSVGSATPVVKETRIPELMNPQELQRIKPRRLHTVMEILIEIIDMNIHSSQQVSIKHRRLPGGIGKSVLNIQLWSKYITIGTSQYTIKHRLASWVGDRELGTCKICLENLGSCEITPAGDAPGAQPLSGGIHVHRQGLLHNTSHNTIQASPPTFYLVSCRHEEEGGVRRRGSHEWK